MENKIHIMKKNIQYLNNGKITQNSLIHSTAIKSANIKIKNGKVFTREFNVARQENDFKNSNSINTKENKLVNWLMNTLNPVNHIPIVSTLNNMANKTNKSLDLVQSVIGGAIYGGGPIGLAKGIGGWVLNKLIIPKNRLANNSEVLEGKLPKNNKKYIKNISDPSSSIQSPNLNLKDSEKNLNISIKQIKTFNNHSLFYPSLELKQKKHIVDIDA